MMGVLLLSFLLSALLPNPVKTESDIPPTCWVDVIPGSPEPKWSKGCGELVACLRIGVVIKRTFECDIETNSSCALSLAETPDLTSRGCFLKVQELQGNLKVNSWTNAETLEFKRLTRVQGSVSIESTGLGCKQVGAVEIGDGTIETALSVTGAIRVEVVGPNCSINRLEVFRLSSGVAAAGVHITADDKAQLGKIWINRARSGGEGVVIGSEGIEIAALGGSVVRPIRVGVSEVRGNFLVTNKDSMLEDVLLDAIGSEKGLEIKKDVILQHRWLNTSIETICGLVEVKDLEILGGSLVVQGLVNKTVGLQVGAFVKDSVKQIQGDVSISFEDKTDVSDSCPKGWVVSGTPNDGGLSRPIMTIAQSIFVLGSSSVRGDGGKDCSRQACLAEEHRSNIFADCVQNYVCLPTEYEAIKPTLSTDRECTTTTVCLKTEFETISPSPTSNRNCEVIRTCDNTEFETDPPSATTNRKCQTIRECTGVEFESLAPSFTSDRQCERKTVCTDVQYESVPASVTSDRTCAPHSKCLPSEYERIMPTSSSDRKCTSYTSCNFETEFQSIPPTLSSDRVCNISRVCITNEYEDIAPTNTSDRECSSLSNCLAGTYISEVATNTSDRVCSSCQNGTFTNTNNSVECTAVRTPCVVGSYEANAPTSSSDRNCVACPEDFAENKSLIDACSPAFNNGNQTIVANESGSEKGLAGWAIAVIIIVVLLLMGTIFVVLRYRKQHIHVDPKVSDSNFQMNPNFGSVRISNGDLSGSAMAAAMQSAYSDVPQDAVVVEEEAYSDNIPEYSLAASQTENGQNEPSDAEGEIPMYLEPTPTIKKQKKKKAAGVGGKSATANVNKTSAGPKKPKKTEPKGANVETAGPPKKKKKPVQNGETAGASVPVKKKTEDVDGLKPKKKKKNVQGAGKPKKKKESSTSEPEYAQPDKTKKKKKPKADAIEQLAEAEETFGFEEDVEGDGYLEINEEADQEMPGL
eukprot:m.88705 g.88705  ORF g.88705 m.88705 type:complete len:977 (+) comp13183_c0_seq1:172-3102(+)